MVEPVAVVNSNVKVDGLSSINLPTKSRRIVFVGDGRLFVWMIGGRRSTLKVFERTARWMVFLIAVISIVYVSPSIRATSG